MLSAEQIPLSLPCHLEWSHCENEYTEEGRRGRSETGFCTHRQGVWPLRYLNNPPAVLKITSSSSDWPDRLGLWGSIISLEFVQQPGRQKTHAHTHIPHTHIYTHTSTDKGRTSRTDRKKTQACRCYMKGAEMLQLLSSIMGQHSWQLFILHLKLVVVVSLTTVSNQITGKASIFF